MCTLIGQLIKTDKTWWKNARWHPTIRINQVTTINLKMMNVRYLAQKESHHFKLSLKTLLIQTQAQCIFCWYPADASVGIPPSSWQRNTEFSPNWEVARFSSRPVHWNPLKFQKCANFGSIIIHFNKL